MSGRWCWSSRSRWFASVPLDVSRSKWAMARRLARGRFRRTRGALGVRSYQALNVMGLRIWVDKPRQFGGKKWRANCATVQRSIDRARGPVFSPRRGLYLLGVDRLTVTGRRVSMLPIRREFCDEAVVVSLDAPDYFAGGGCESNSARKQMVAVREVRR